MKKHLSICLVIVMLIIVIPLGAFEFEISAATRGYYTYSVLYGEATITDVNISISGSVTIISTLGGYPVTSIGSYAFYNCTSLEDVYYRGSITDKYKISIGSNNSNLTNAT